MEAKKLIVSVLVVSFIVSEVVARAPETKGAQPNSEFNLTEKLESCLRKCKTNEEQCAADCVKNEFADLHDKQKSQELLVHMAKAMRGLFCIAGCVESKTMPASNESEMVAPCAKFCFDDLSHELAAPHKHDEH